MNNLPIGFKRENIFQKFIRFFKSIFRKNVQFDSEAIIKEEAPKPETKTMEMYKVDSVSIENIKKDNNKTMQDIIDIIEKNPETLQKLDIEKLELVDQYYVEKIAKYNKILGNNA